MILAWLLHAVYATILAFLLSEIFGQLSPTIAWVSLVLGAILGLWQSRRILAQNPGLKLFTFASGEAGLIEVLLSVFIFYAAARHFVWMLFPLDFGWATLSLNNYGDLPLHINFIRAFAGGVSFPPKNPIYAADLLRYPFGVDLYSALLEQIGIRLQAHLAFVGVLSTCASLILLRCFGGWAAIGAFFLSGGLAGWEVLRGSPLQDFLSKVDWKNLLLSVYITQRGMLLALPLGLYLLVILRRHLSAERVLSGGQLAGLGLLLGFFPLFHLHAFVAVSLLIGAMAFEFGGFRGFVRLMRSPLIAVALLPAFWFVMFSSHFGASASIVRIKWGWVSHEGERFRFLLENFGPWLLVPVFIPLTLWLRRRLFSKDELRRFAVEYLAYLLLFGFFYNVMMAPWEWDNIKLLIWPYLGFARLLWLVLERGSRGRLGNLERSIFAVILFFSGVVTIAWTLQSPVVPEGRVGVLYNFGELANTEGALRAVPINAVFAAAPSHMHQLTYFGRLRAVGYAGHLWSHGIDGRVAIDKLQRLMTGDSDSIRLAHELGVTHIFWGPLERAQYGDADLPWMHQLLNVSRVAGYAIYAVP